jgi:carboxypeptidase family protein
VKLVQRVLLALVIFSSSALAQASAPEIMGIVLDRTGHPMASARVYVIGSQDSIQTDPRGRFTFHILQAHIVSLRAEFIGYMPDQRDSLVLKRGKSVWVEFRLRPEPVPEIIDVFRGSAVPDSS